MTEGTTCASDLLGRGGSGQREYDVSARQIGMAAQNYGKTVQHARETTLHHDLQVMRQAIDNYTLDKQAAPQSLEDLVQAGYLRKVPVDPITVAADWVPQYDSVVLSPDQSSTGMVDVHSNSPRVSPFENTPYNEW